MTWMLTASGSMVNLHLMDAATISVLDIAHHLSQLNRFTGACSRPYSVAEHSLMVTEIIERELGERRPHVLLAALMHDAHEAYTNDLSQPMKELLGDAWKRVEDRIQLAVLRRFDLAEAFAELKASIKWADLTALVSERTSLMPAHPNQWQVMQTHKAVTWIDFKHQERFGWTDWRAAFLDRFSELNFARQLTATTALL